MNSKELESVKGTHLTYQGENDRAYSLTDGDGASLLVQKNRRVPDTLISANPQPLTWAFRLLALAILGLALSGLGTLLFAPLAILWTLYVYFTHSIDKAGRIRTAIVLVVSIGLLALAIPLSLLFLARIA